MRESTPIQNRIDTMKKKTIKKSVYFCNLCIYNVNGQGTGD